MSAPPTIATIYLWFRSARLFRISSKDTDEALAFFLVGCLVCCLFPIVIILTFWTLVLSTLHSFYLPPPMQLGTNTFNKSLAHQCNFTIQIRMQIVCGCFPYLIIIKGRDRGTRPIGCIQHYLLPFLLLLDHHSAAIRKC